MKAMRTVAPIVGTVALFSSPAVALVGSAASQAYGLEMIPLRVILHRSRCVHWVHTGHPGNYAHLVREQLNKLLAAQ